MQVLFLIFFKKFHVFHVYSFFTHFPVFHALDHCGCKCYYQSTKCYRKKDFLCPVSCVLATASQTVAGFFPQIRLGNGYVKILSGLLHNAGYDFSMENRGIDGFTLERLLQNTDSWLEASDPDIVTVLIGINDIGIMMNTRRSSAQQQDLMEIFAARYEQLARKLSGTDSRKRKLFFLEPFVFPWPRCYASWFPLLSQMSVTYPNNQSKIRRRFCPAARRSESGSFSAWNVSHNGRRHSSYQAGTPDSG